MQDMRANPKSLTSSYSPADKSSPILEETIGAALMRLAETHAARTALIDGGAGGARRRWSYAGLAEESRKVANALLQHFEPGDHVAVWASNCPEWVLLELGASLAGLVLVTVNPAHLAHELKYVLEKSDARGVVVQDHYRGRNLLQILDETRNELPLLHTVLRLSALDDLKGNNNQKSLPTVEATDRAQIQFTSGTTGFPKGACLSHRGLSNNGRLYAEAIGATACDVWVNPMPMFHTAGCGLATLGALHTGGAHIIPPEFDAGVLLDLFQQERGTIMLCVPTMLIRMLEEQENNPRDVSSWRLVTLGGAPVPAELVRRAEKVLGVEVAIGFGQTEASPYLTHTAVKDPHPTWFETVGKVLPQTELKIVDPATGDIAPIDVSGEICARGYSVMEGYYKNTEATRAAIDQEGWLHTGDIGAMDALGYCRVHGRLRDMIIRGGENIYPKEVEDVLFEHPAVASVAVIGLPDPEWGEVVAACLILRDGQAAAAEDLEKFCREKLASFKVPRSWIFLDSFPQTASGKIQKFALRKQLLEVNMTEASGLPAISIEKNGKEDLI